jgi:FSR family fosmidomycin resistance protein-like MFS transporter
MSGAAAHRSGIDRRGIGVLATGHGFVDMTQGVVAALLPFMISRRGYGYAEATTLMLAMTITSSVIQPLFGHLADRRSMPWMLPGGVLVAGLGIAAAGVAPTHLLTLAAVAVAGLGVGAYHPEAARFANYVSGDRRASGMSLFAVGGNAGFAVGPMLVTPLVLAFGLGGTALLVVPALVVAVVLAVEMPRLRSFAPTGDPSAATGTAAPTQPDRWGPFAHVASIAAWRSAVYFGLQAFVPAFLIFRLGSSEAVANVGLTVLLVAGALGTLTGGVVADRVGRRPVLVGSMALLGPLVLLLLVTGTVTSFVLLAVIGFVGIGTFSTTVVLGQEYLPNRVGVASGVTLGAAIGFGGVAAALLGQVADGIGLNWVMALIAVLALPGLVSAVLLPRDARPEAITTTVPDVARAEPAPASS